MDERFSKSVKKQLHTLAGRAYELELTAALTGLESLFASWRAGNMNAFDLNDAIHAFHDGPARELYKTYVMARQPEWNVASAVERKILSEVEVGPEVMQALARNIEALRAQPAAPDDA
jgi:hypothetical protein